jgi:hypothetical protein
MNWLAQIAPTIATALGGPLAGLAVEAVSKAIGVSPEDTQALLDNGKLTADQIGQIKLAEISLKSQAQNLGLDFEKLAVADRSSARDMQVATKSYTPSILAGVVIGGFAVITLMKVMGVPVAADPTIQDLLTTLRDGVILVLSFYFGSSSGSQAKNELLHNSTPTP